MPHAYSSSSKPWFEDSIRFPVGSIWLIRLNINLDFSADCSWPGYRDIVTKPILSAECLGTPAQVKDDSSAVVLVQLYFPERIASLGKATAASCCNTRHAQGSSTTYFVAEAPPFIKSHASCIFSRPCPTTCASGLHFRVPFASAGVIHRPQIAGPTAVFLRESPQSGQVSKHN